MCVAGSGCGEGGVLREELGSATIKCSLLSSRLACLGLTLHITGSEATLSPLGELFSAVLSERARRMGRRSPPELEL